MTAVKRVIANLKDGPLKGQQLSVALNAAGKPPPITSVGDMPEGSSYVPAGKRAKLGKDHVAADWPEQDLAGRYEYTFKPVG